VCLNICRYSFLDKAF